jgi:thymidylate synthase (FAD)
MTELEFLDTSTVALISHCMSDKLIVNAARVSTQGELVLEMDDAFTDADAKLINYLAREEHLSPFEHNSITFYVHTPLFVIQEMLRHRSASFNQESGRYRKLKPVFYIPNAGRPWVQEGKPGHYTFVAGSEDQFLSIQHNLKAVYTAAYGAYERLLEEGVAREVARTVLPSGLYSSLYVTMNFRNLMHFLQLRLPDNAQFEIREVAEQMRNLTMGIAPFAYAAMTQELNS